MIVSIQKSTSYMCEVDFFDGILYHKCCMRCFQEIQILGGQEFE